MPVGFREVDQQRVGGQAGVGVAASLNEPDALSFKRPLKVDTGATENANEIRSLV